MAIREILEAMKANAVPDGASNLWYVQTRVNSEVACSLARIVKNREVGPGPYKLLRRYTDSTVHSGGEVVMEDTLHELRQHLQFVRCASGRVLVTGLGLGCVVRGLLVRPEVTSIDVVEISQDVLKLVSPFMPADPRLKIHHDDAEKFISRNYDSWDCAWHDLWSDVDDGAPGLQLIHARIMIRLQRRVHLQGAWKFPKSLRNYLDHSGIPQIELRKDSFGA